MHSEVSDTEKSETSTSESILHDNEANDKSVADHKININVMENEDEVFPLCIQSLFIRKLVRLFKQMRPEACVEWTVKT